MTNNTMAKKKQTTKINVRQDTTQIHKDRTTWNGVNSGASEGYVVPVPLVTPVVLKFW